MWEAVARYQVDVVLLHDVSSALSRMSHELTSGCATPWLGSCILNSMRPLLQESEGRWFLRAALDSIQRLTCVLLHHRAREPRLLKCQARARSSLA